MMRRWSLGLACACGTPCFYAEWNEILRRREERMVAYLSTPMYVTTDA